MRDVDPRRSKRCVGKPPIPQTLRKNIAASQPAAPLRVPQPALD